MEGLIDNRYKVLKTLGEGGFGRVYLVHDTQKGEDLALKSLNVSHLEPAKKEIFLASLQTEFEVLAKLKHPNLAQVFDYGADPASGEHYFTQEFVEGQSIFEATEKQPPSIIEGFFVEVLRALEYIHTHGVVHYDIKPSNILVTSSSQVKLLDFGLATHRLATRSFTAGTAKYVAPEILSGVKTPDPRSDLYSLAVVLFELLTRRLPFLAEDNEIYMQAHLHETPPRMSQIDPAIPNYLDELVTKLLSKDPKDRFGRAQTIIRYLNLHTKKKYPVETKTTLKSYTFASEVIGRTEILDELKDQMDILAGAMEPDADFPFHPNFFLVGEAGTGKTRILREIKYYAQLHGIEAKIQLVDDVQDNPSTRRELLLGQMRKTAWEATHKSKCERIILAAWRLESKGEIPTWIEELTQQRVTQLVELSSFSDEEIREYLISFTGIEDVPHSLVSQLVQVTGGNPFFLEEVLKAVVDQGSLFARGGLELKKKIPIPASVQKVIAKKIANLSPAAESLLALLAAWGEPISWETLKEVTKLTAPDLAVPLTELKSKGFLTEMADPISIANTSLQESTYQSIAPSERIHWHRACAAFLERRGISDGEALGPLAYHLERGGPPEKAIPYLMRWGETQEKNQNIEKAAQTFSRLLMLKPNQEVELDVKRRLVRLYGLLGNYTQAFELNKKISSKTRRKSPTEFAKELRALAWLHFKKGEVTQALQYYKEALEKIPEATDANLRIMLLNDLGSIHFLRADYQKAKKYFKDGLKVLRRLDTYDPDTFNNNKLGMTESVLGRMNEASAFQEEKLKWAKASQDPQANAIATDEMAFIYMRAGDLDKAAEFWETSISISEEIGYRHNLINQLTNLTTLYQRRAKYQRALKYADEAVTATVEFGTPRQIGAAHMALGNLYLTLGLFDAAWQNLQTALSQLEVAKELELQGWTHLMLAILYDNAGLQLKSEVSVGEAIKIGARLPSPLLSGYSYLALANAKMEMENWDAVEDLLEKVAACANKIRDEQFELSWYLTLLKAFTQLKPQELDRGPELFSKLLEKSNRLGSEELGWEVHYALGMYELQKGDKQAAGPYLETAKGLIDEIAAELGEEYRESYLRQKSIRKVFEALERVTKV